MPLLRFTDHLARFADASETQAQGVTVAELLADLFQSRPRLRSYLLDDQGCMRKHVNAFIDGEQIRDRLRLSDAVAPDSVVDFIQALSGG